MAVTTAKPTAGITPEPTRERVASLRQLGERDPRSAQDGAWGWFEELGRLAGRDRETAAWELAELFGCGRASRGIDGPTEGILVAPLIQARVDRVLRLITGQWMPWLGKSFHAGEARGENRLAGSARWASKLLWPAYVTHGGAAGERLAFDFETRVERGGVEPAVDVFVIDYAPIEQNPGFIIRRIRDELVEIVPGAHLGRILWRRGDGGYANIGYFALRTPVS
jgi:hypothetical protein